jgi:tetraacyldisaccharide 4'-kinase
MLLPLAVMFRGLAAVRGWLYDARVLRRHALGAPAVSVGNLSTGGTGKTPVASYLAAELSKSGARPAILLRGYGDDEHRVHEVLNPSAIVVADADRVRGAREARDRGADVLVLDDAFQHRRAERDADVVLVSADALGDAPWPLPAGPWREPMIALRRASLVVVTRRVASQDLVDTAVRRIASAAPRVPVAIVRLVSDEAFRWNAPERIPLRDLAGRSVVAVSGIGDPAAFEAQLSRAGIAADVMRFPDHHRYAGTDVATIVARGRPGGLVVCTLKDAVKLGPQWPPGGVPLWYVTQRISIEQGAGLVGELIDGMADKAGRIRTKPDEHGQGRTGTDKAGY